ncbi:MAG: hypothetical protein DRJ61_08145 [Acidobacteria bacterium]|nr:MAG: hypothetical protein DRJ61_08145 [Acidobacteriota bacterium]
MTSALTALAETRLLRRSPWIARCRLSSQRCLGLKVCRVKKAAPGTSRRRGVLLISGVDPGFGMTPVC